MCCAGRAQGVVDAVHGQPQPHVLFVTVTCPFALQDGRKEFLMLFMAIASHKLISGLALSSRFLKDGATTRQVRTLHMFVQTTFFSV
jgi:hypothetical protein